MANSRVWLAGAVAQTEEEYDAGLCADVCKLQLAKDLAGVAASDMKDVVIAYEPV